MQPANHSTAQHNTHTFGVLLVGMCGVQGATGRRVRAFLAPLLLTGPPGLGWCGGCAADHLQQEQQHPSLLLACRWWRQIAGSSPTCAPHQAHGMGAAGEVRGGQGRARENGAVAAGGCAGCWPHPNVRVALLTRCICSSMARHPRHLHLFSALLPPSPPPPPLHQGKADGQPSLR